MIALQKYIGGTWDACKGLLRLDLDAIQEAINALQNLILGGTAGTLSPTLIQGDSSVVPRYVANTGTKNTPNWDQVDLSSTGVKGRLPYSHLVAAASPSLLLGRESGSSGDWEAIQLDASLKIVGTTLEVVGGGSSWVPLTTGAEPLAFVSDGAGNPVFVAYTP